MCICTPTPLYTEPTPISIVDADQPNIEFVYIFVDNGEIFGVSKSPFII